MWMSKLLVSPSYLVGYSSRNIQFYFSTEKLTNNTYHSLCVFPFLSRKIHLSTLHFSFNHSPPKSTFNFIGQIIYYPKEDVDRSMLRHNLLISSRNDLKILSNIKSLHVLWVQMFIHPFRVEYIHFLFG